MSQQQQVFQKIVHDTYTLKAKQGYKCVEAGVAVKNQQLTSWRQNKSIKVLKDDLKKMKPDQTTYTLRPEHDYKELQTGCGAERLDHLQSEGRTDP